MPQDLMARLAEVELFAALPRDLLASLAEHAKTLQFGLRERIVTQGDSGGSLYSILAGFVKVTATSVDGRETLLSFMGPGDVFGELSVLDGLDRSATVTALSPVVVVTIEQAALFTLIESSPRFAIEILKSLCKRVRILSTRCEAMNSMPIPLRLAHDLLTLAERHGEKHGNSVRIPIRLSQQDLGAFVGATRESVNKQIGAWTAAGILKIEGGYLTLPNLETFRAIIQSANVEASR